MGTLFNKLRAQSLLPDGEDFQVFASDPNTRFKLCQYLEIKLKLKSFTFKDLSDEFSVCDNRFLDLERNYQTAHNFLDRQMCAEEGDAEVVNPFCVICMQSHDLSNDEEGKVLSHLIPHSILKASETRSVNLNTGQAIPHKKNGYRAFCKFRAGGVLSCEDALAHFGEDEFAPALRHFLRQATVPLALSLTITPRIYHCFVSIAWRFAALSPESSAVSVLAFLEAVRPWLRKATESEIPGVFVRLFPYSPAELSSLSKRFNGDQSLALSVEICWMDPAWMYCTIVYQIGALLVVVLYSPAQIFEWCHPILAGDWGTKAAPKAQVTFPPIGNRTPWPQPLLDRFMKVVEKIPPPNDETFTSGYLCHQQERINILSPPGIVRRDLNDVKNSSVQNGERIYEEQPANGAIFRLFKRGENNYWIMFAKREATKELLACFRIVRTQDEMYDIDRTSLPPNIQEDVKAQMMKILRVNNPLENAEDYIVPITNEAAEIEEGMFDFFMEKEEEN